MIALKRQRRTLCFLDLCREACDVIPKPYKQKLGIEDMTKITNRYEVFLNCGRNAFSDMPDVIRKAEAMKEVKMYVVPKALRRGILDIDKNIPDVLVSKEMAERYLEITPPSFTLIRDYQLIINEIEQSYVIGNDFSSLSASCVVIERLLNQARIALHKHHKVIKKLRNKGPKNDWPSNIKALKKWGYIDDDFAPELSDIYVDIRCRYLHSGEIRNIRQDALRAITAAYKLMKIFIGFPEDLFDGVTCKDEADPRYLAFYKPYLHDKESNMEMAAQTQTEMRISELWNKYARLLNESKYDEACERCSELDKLKPNDYVVLNNWGSTLSLLAKLRKDEKLFEQAHQKFELAVNIEPEKYEAYCNWSIALTEWARLKGDEKLFEQAHQKFEQAVNIESNKPEVYDNWAGILIYWSKLKIGTPEYEGLLKQAEGKCLKAESLRKGSSAYKLARIYALRSDEEQCKKWLMVGQETGTLPDRDYAMKDSDLARVKSKPWFTEIKWKGEK
jgi:tetratricopeptide (TPR) repeat protein